MEEQHVRLISAARQGDKDAFSQLVTLYKDYVYRIAYGVLTNHAEAQDVTQEVFVTTFLRLSSLREPAAFPAWLARATTNRAIDVTKRRRRYSTIPIEDQQIPGPSNEIEQVDNQLSVERLLAELTPIHRAVIVLREIQGLDYEQIANVLDVPVGTVRSRLSNARTQLKRLVEKSDERRETI